MSGGDNCFDCYHDSHQKEYYIRNMSSEFSFLGIAICDLNASQL